MISRQCAPTRKGDDGDTMLENSQLKHVVPKLNNSFFARLRGTH